MIVFIKNYCTVKSAQRKALVLVLTILMTSFLSGCYFFPKEEETLAPPLKEPEKVTFETVEVKKGSIENIVRYSGYLESVTQMDLFYKGGGGRLKALHVKNGDMVKKGDLLVELESDTLVNDIKLQEIACKKSRIAYDRLKMQLEIDGGGDKSQLDLAALDVESDKLRLDYLSKLLGETRLVSPIDGQVVFTPDVKLGDFINAYESVIRVADLNDLQIKYASDRVSDFDLGMKLDVEIAGKLYKGAVVATPAEMPSNASEDQKKSVYIKVNDMPRDVEIGDLAFFTLTLEKRDDVIVLPKRVVNTALGRTFVNILSNGIREERDVQLGIQTETEVEVMKGLDVGELVIVM